MAQRGRPRIDYPPTKQATLMDIAWAAGFYEGEGCCVLTPNGSDLMITMTQKQKEPLERFSALFGGKIYSNNTEKRDAWIYSIKYERAWGLAFTLFPFLSREKRDQIINAIKRYQVFQSLKSV